MLDKVFSRVAVHVIIDWVGGFKFFLAELVKLWLVWTCSMRKKSVGSTI